MQTIQNNTSSNSYLLREAWVDDLMYRYAWHEFATCTFKHQQHDETRALGMFVHWLNGRYFDHAVKVGDATKEQKPKLDKGKPVVDLVRQFIPVDGHRDDRCVMPVRVPRVLTSYSGPFKNRWRRHPGIRPVWVVGIEHHREGGNHIHALIHHRVYQDELRRTDGWDSWHNQLGYGRMRLEPPKSDKDVRRYLSKYVCKSGSIELSPSFEASALPGRAQLSSAPATEGAQSPSAG